MIRKITKNPESIKGAMGYIQLWTGLFFVIFTSLLGWIPFNTDSFIFKYVILLEIVILLIIIILITVFGSLLTKLSKSRK